MCARSSFENVFAPLMYFTGSSLDLCFPVCVPVRFPPARWPNFYPGAIFFFRGPWGPGGYQKNLQKLRKLMITQLPPARPNTQLQLLMFKVVGNRATRNARNKPWGARVATFIFACFTLMFTSVFLCASLFFLVFLRCLK